MELICEKGIGKTHAKWSPVCTAWYRNMPDIRITAKIEGEEARELVKTCPVGVFDIEELGKNKVGARVKDASKCTSCRECLRFEKFESRLDVGKLKDVFEFHVESLGIYKPEEIVTEALAKLKSKAVFWLDVAKKEEAGVN